VAAAAAEGHTVTVVPGPSAVLAALAVSGLAADRFTYEGFLPRRGGERAQRIAAVAASTCPSVIFEAPARVGGTLGDLAEACGESRRVAVCRELTKLYEETWRGTLADASRRAATSVVRGEHVLVVDGAPADAGAPSPGEVEGLLSALLGAGVSRRDAVDQVAERLGVRRRQVYDVALRLKSPGDAGEAG
jgi:16S rRNA (cytidine1402-2'-O)-methyltransferase